MDQEIITTTELHIKCKSKKEMHQLMTTQEICISLPLNLAIMIMWQEL